MYALMYPCTYTRVHVHYDVYRRKGPEFNYSTFSQHASSFQIFSNIKNILRRNISLIKRWYLRNTSLTWTHYSYSIIHPSFSNFLFLSFCLFPGTFPKLIHVPTHFFKVVMARPRNPGKGIWIMIYFFFAFPRFATLLLLFFIISYPLSFISFIIYLYSPLPYSYLPLLFSSFPPPL